MKALIALFGKALSLTQFEGMEPPPISTQADLTHPVIKCHRFILQDRWPYFANINQNMREATEGRLSLPAAGEPDGMHPIVLNALLEVCYTGEISKETRELITMDIAMHLLSAQIYFKTGAVLERGGKVGVDPPFRALYAFAEQQFVDGITNENCVDHSQHGVELEPQ